jgi:uncharacterized membrane protein
MLRAMLLLTALALGSSFGAPISKPAQAAPTPPAYTITMIPLLPGCSGLDAQAINSAGDIVGTAYGATTKAVLYHNGKLTDLSRLLPPNTNSSANGINDFGEIIGSYTGGAFIYQGSHVQLLPYTSPNFFEFIAVNDLGQIIGRQGTNTELPSLCTPFLRQPNGAMVQIPPYKGAVLNPTAINNVGQITAIYYSTVTTPGGSVLLQSGGRNPVDLGTLGSDLEASALNVWGQVVGDYQAVDDLDDGAPINAFLYSGRTLTNLGSFYGLDWYDGGAEGTAINDLGVIVGSSQAILGEQSIASVYMNGAWYDLNEVGTVSGFTIPQYGNGPEFLTYGIAINNAGVIIAEANNIENESQPILSYILTPVKVQGSERLK